MKGVILVLQNPFFARPDADGGFLIRGVPEGTRQLKVYRPGAAAASLSVKVPRRGTVTVAL